MLKAHKIRLNPTPEQEAYLWKAANVARFTYNWGLARWNELSDSGYEPKVAAIKKEFNSLKAEQFPWIKEVTKCASEGAFMDLRAAFKNYFERKQNGQLIPPPDWKPCKDGKPFGYPCFKKKRKATPAFYVANDKFKVDGHSIQVPKLGWVDMYESLRFEGKLMSARFSYYAGWWWVSITVEVKHDSPKHQGGAIGLDLGVKDLIVTSDNQVFENQKHLKRRLRQVKKLQRLLSRKQQDSNNYQKANLKLAKAHYKVACARKDFIHKATTQITKQHALIGVEDLNVKGMLQNHNLAQAVSDASPGETVRQLEYKATWFGGRVVYVARFFPSSKLHNGCGWLNTALRLSDREWICQGCGEVVRRDYNAALNIRDEALRLAQA